MSDLYDEFHRLAQTEGNDAIRCSRMHFSEWADDVDKLDHEIERLREEIERLRAHNERLWLFVAEQCCECFDEYGVQREVECERCQLMRAAKAGGCE